MPVPTGSAHKAAAAKTIFLLILIDMFLSCKDRRVSVTGVRVGDVSRRAEPCRDHQARKPCESLRRPRRARRMDRPAAQSLLSPLDGVGDQTPSAGPPVAFPAASSRARTPGLAA